MGRVVNPMVWPLYPQKIATVPIVQKAGWRTRVDLCEEEKISFPHRGSKSQTIHSVTRAKHAYLQESQRLYCSCPSSLQFPPTGLPAVHTQQPQPGTWETPASASLQSAWLQQINMSATVRIHSWSMSQNSPPPVNPRLKTKHWPQSRASWNQTTHYSVKSLFNITFPSMSVSPKKFFLSDFRPPKKWCRVPSTREVENSNVCSEIGCLKAWVSKLLWQRGTPIIVGWFAGHTCKKHQRYT